MSGRPSVRGGRVSTSALGGLMVYVFIEERRREEPPVLTRHEAGEPVTPRRSKQFAGGRSASTLQETVQGTVPFTGNFSHIH